MCPFLHSNQACSGAPGALLDAAVSLPDRSGMRSGAHQRRLPTAVRPKRHGSTPLLAKTFAKFVFFEKSFRFLWVSLEKGASFRNYLVVFGACPVFHGEYALFVAAEALSDAARAVPESFWKRSGPPRHASRAHFGQKDTSARLILPKTLSGLPFSGKKEEEA